jgi:hypothetical protein
MVGMMDDLYFVAMYTFFAVDQKNKYLLLGMQPPPTLASFRAVKTFISSQ